MAIQSGEGVVTGSPTELGQAISPGGIVSELNGRPVFAVTGKFRFYRDLFPGNEGPDVVQLQRALTGAGFQVPDTGFFGSLTEEAVRSMYKIAGYKVIETAKGTADQGQEDSVSGAESADASIGEPAEIKVLSVPMAEFAVFPTLPAVVETLPAVGEEQSEGLEVRVRSGVPVATASMTMDLASQFVLGSTGTLEVKGISVAVVVDNVAQQLEPAGDEATSGALASNVVTFVGADAVSIPDDLNGHSGIITIVLETVAADALLVPTAALVSQGNESRILVERDDEFRSVPVVELGRLDGRSAVSPIVDGALLSGDMVRID